MSEPAVPPARPPPVVPRPAAWRRLPRPVLGLLAALLLFLGWEVFTSFIAYTDDAYVRSDLVALVPEVSGHLAGIAVADEQAVHRGELLATIDPVPFRLAVAAAQAALQEADAKADAAADSVTAAQDRLDAANALLPDAQATEQRAATLSARGFATFQAQDNALAALRSRQAEAAARQAELANAQAARAAAQAGVARAQAALAIAQWQLTRTSLLAPVDGIVTNLNLRPGDMAEAGTPLIGIVAARNWRIIANYKQYYLPELRPGATAWVWLDANPWHLYRGRIRTIGRAISRGPDDGGLLPYVNPTTDWIRLQHRFPVTIDLVNPPPGLTLYMGADARCLIFP